MVVIAQKPQKCLPQFQCGGQMFIEEAKDEKNKTAIQILLHNTNDVPSFFNDVHARI